MKVDDKVLAFFQSIVDKTGVNPYAAAEVFAIGYISARFAHYFDDSYTHWRLIGVFLTLVVTTFMLVSARSSVYREAFLPGLGFYRFTMLVLLIFFSVVMTLLGALSVFEVSSACEVVALYLLSCKKPPPKRKTFNQPQVDT